MVLKRRLSQKSRCAFTLSFSVPLFSNGCTLRSLNPRFTVHFDRKLNKIDLNAKKECPVQSVTVFNDRAEITRLISTDIEDGNLFLLAL